MANHATAGAATTSVRTPGPRVSLRRLRVAWLDLLLPERAGPLLVVVASVSLASWLAGLLLAEDRARFLASREWQVEPVYLAVHLVVVRLFVTAYAGGYLAGCRALVMSRREAERSARRVLGPAGFAAALVLAAPLVGLDVAYVLSDRYESATSAGRGAGDWLLAAIWGVEWIATAYVWVVILGFLAAAMHAINRHPFRDHVTKVLRERQYRPFLLMSSRGATIVLVFSAASVGYVVYASGEASDYLGLWVTAGLLLVGFVPPWARLRSRISDLVREETDRIGARVDAEFEGRAGARDPAPPRTIGELGERVQAAVAFLRIEHVHRLHADMGRTEAREVLLRLLAPAATIAWRLMRGG